MAADPRRLETALHYVFRDTRLLRQALTHRSFGQPHNERLEFLGDSILNAAAARLLFDAFPACSEGELSRLRASLVKKETLAELAQGLDLGAHVWLGEGELRSGGIGRPSILADALEALIAAIYLDGGFDAAAGAVGHLLAPTIAAIDPDSHGKDSKTRLQEWLQARKLKLPRYTILSESGVAHEKLFEVECRIDGLDLVTCGRGTSRRTAEQEAAALALANLPKTTKRPT
ncbi:ribonuclease III [Chitinimonas lacunae]|uniref:Ribonuclease 3 n=1 Tax=Chitinimonas lacunae TaxID=1963018 RepID=A0ABV8MQ22_9NEIS